MVLASGLVSIVYNKMVVYPNYFIRLPVGTGTDLTRVYRYINRGTSTRISIIKYAQGTYTPPQESGQDFAPSQVNIVILRRVYWQTS
jgi:hypothetical protein